MVQPSRTALPLALSLLAAPAAAEPETGAEPAPTAWAIQAELHGSLFADIADRSLIAGTYGPAVRVAHRWGRWGAFLQVEHDFWLSTELESEVVQGAYNIGLGGEVTYHGGAARTALALGPSILAYDTVLDEAGEVGIFFDLRPVGLRWPIAERWHIGLDPIGFTVVAPVLDGIPLVQFEYRTALYVEWSP